MVAVLEECNLSTATQLGHLVLDDDTLDGDLHDRPVMIRSLINNTRTLKTNKQTN